MCAVDKEREWSPALPVARIVRSYGKADEASKFIEIRGAQRRASPVGEGIDRFFLQRC